MGKMLVRHSSAERKRKQKGRKLNKQKAKIFTITSMGKWIFSLNTQGEDGERDYIGLY